MAQSLRSLSRSFAAGEVTPELYGHIDLAKFQTGLAIARNFYTLPHGPVANRPGFAFVRETKNSAVVSRLIPFSYSNSQAFAIEVGAGYFRFHAQGAVLLAGAPAAFANPSATITSSIPTAAAAVTVSIATPAVVTWAAHGLPANAPVVFTTTGALPTGLVAGTTYYVSATGLVAGSFQVSATPGGASINTTGTQSGTHTCTPSANIGWTAHGLAANTPVTFSTSGALPTGLTAGTTYYVRNPQTNQFEVSATSAGAAVVTSGTQSGVHTGYRGYVLGDLVASGGTNYYCVANTVTANAPPNATYWYALPASGEYEIPNNYAAADLFDLHYVQSADVLTLVHPTYPVTELRRYGATNWQLAYPTFQAPTNAPTGVSATATTGTGSTSYTYAVTTVNTAGLEESVASSTSAPITNDLTTTPNKNTVSWTAVSGAIRYNVYKLANGLLGYIGQSASTAFIDQNIVPDVSKTPPINDTGFNDATGNYPGAVTYNEQRRCFGGTNNKPQNIWMTRSATESNMSYSIPTVADNRIAFRIAAREASRVQHLVPVANLMMFTPSCEWKVTSGDGNALSSANITVKPQSYIGANNVTPAVVGNSILFAAARGGHLREMSYNWQANGYLTQDICLLAPHLFDYNSIVDMAYQKSPYPMLWCVSSSGQLLGMTYVPEQQVAGWHHHDTTNGVFESVCCITENNQDYLYAIINRTFGGVTHRFVERMASRYFNTVADTFFVDCGAQYNGAPATTISGLDWLNGQTVNILADGAVVPPQVVTGGAITLTTAASKVTVGLPITADVQTLPLEVQIDGAFGQGRLMNVNSVFLRVYRSSGILAGPSFDKLTQYKQRTTEPYGTPPNPVSAEIKIPILASWENNGQVCIRQTDPLPLTIASMTIEVAAGG